MVLADIITTAFWSGWPTAQYAVLAVAVALIALALKAYTEWRIVERLPDLGDARQIIGGVSAIAAGLLVLMTPLATMIPFIGLDAPISLTGEAPEAPEAPGVPGVPPALVVAPPTGGTIAIDNLTAQVKEKSSNSYTTFTGYMEIYEADVDPSDPTANYIVRLSVISGVGFDSNGYVSVNYPYRVVLNGNGTWYDKDYGVISFAEAGYNKATGRYLFRDADGAGKMGTIADMLDENTTGGDVNGLTTYSTGAELRYACTQYNDSECYSGYAVDSLIYNETTGDQSFYIKPTITIGGGNTEIHDLVYCYEWDATNPPEGNEVSALTYQLESGASLGFPSNLLPFWSSESCISLYAGEPVLGGTSSKVKFSYTVSEANLVTGGDIWKEHIDDLGDINGKSLLLSTGATGDSIQFDSVT